MSREQLRRLRHELRETKWDQLIVKLGLGMTPSAMMVAVLLDLLDRNLPGSQDGPVGRGFLLAVHALTQWIDTIIAAQQELAATPKTSSRNILDNSSKIGIFVDPSMKEGIELLAEALSSQPYRAITAQPPRPDNQAFIAALAVMSLRDPDGEALSKKWNDPQRENWDRLSAAIYRGLWCEFAHLIERYQMGDRITSASLGDCVHALVKLRNKWHEFPAEACGWIPCSLRDMATLPRLWPFVLPQAA